MDLYRLEPHFNGRYMDELAEVAREYIKDQIGSLKPATIKNKLSYLRAACKYAQADHGMGDQDAQYKIAMPTVDNERHFYEDHKTILKLSRAMTSIPATAPCKYTTAAGTSSQLVPNHATGSALSCSIIAPSPCGVSRAVSTTIHAAATNGSESAGSE